MNIRLLVFISALILSAVLHIQAQDFASLTAAGEAARQFGDYKRAFADFDEALKLAESAGDRSKQAQIFSLRGQIHYLQAEYNPAIRAFRQAEKMANAAGDKREEARAWAFLGQLYWRVMKAADSERLLKDALRVFEKTNDEINIALTLRFLGRLENGKPATYLKPVQGFYSNAKPALDYYERSLAISQRIGDEEGELTTLKEIGLVYQNQDKLPNWLEIAMSYFESLRVRLKDSNYRRLYAVVLNNIATNQYYSGRADRNNSGVIEKDKLEKSMETADEAARIFREIGDRQELREMIDRKSFCLIYLGQFEEALSVIEESIKIADDLYNQPIGGELDRSRYFESLIGSYRQKMDVLYNLKRPAEMFETYEAVKSWSLRELMNRGKNGQNRIPTADETAEEIRLNAEIIALNRQILQTKQNNKTAILRLADLNRQLQKARLAQEEWQGNIAAKNEETIKPSRPENLKIARLCSAIPDQKTALIEYEANKDHLGVTFILMKTDADFEPSTQTKNLLVNNLLTETIALSDGSICTLNLFYNKGYWVNEQYNQWGMQLAARMSEFREQIARNSPAFKTNAKFIYDSLIADAIPFLKDKTNLVIIPGGKVADVPFQALMNENGRYLIEDFAVSYAPSVTTLAEMQANRRKLAGYQYDGDFLAFGNPKLSNETIAKFRSRYRDGKLGNLPEAEAEVNAIGKFYPNKRILTGGKATEDVWREEAAKFRILHLATHGLSDGEKPLYSHVLLAADADDDGLIEGREIADLKLNAEMVVLSACETARGREIDGEGLVGLAWSFAAAGVPTVVASSWKVDSETTADLMVDFYGELNKKSKLSKAEALQAAVIKKINNPATKNPFYWAGFSLIGDWSN